MAFTLIELLVVIAIIALLLAILLPGLSLAKEHEIDDPSPAHLLFFVGVHEDGILDSHFGIPPRGPTYGRSRPQWWDLPTGRHSQGGCFSFADGHVERWRWDVPKIFIELGQRVGQDEVEDFVRVQRGVRPEKTSSRPGVIAR